MFRPAVWKRTRNLRHKLNLQQELLKNIRQRYSPALGELMCGGLVPSMKAKGHVSRKRQYTVRIFLLRSVIVGQGVCLMLQYDIQSVRYFE